MEEGNLTRGGDTSAEVLAGLRRLPPDECYQCLSEIRQAMDATLTPESR